MAVDNLSFTLCRNIIFKYIWNFVPSNKLQMMTTLLSKRASCKTNFARCEVGQTTGKIMASAFWNVHRYLFLRKISRDRCEAQLVRWKKKVLKIVKKKKILFYQNNGPCHMSIKTIFIWFRFHWVLPILRPQKSKHKLDVKTEKLLFWIVRTRANIHFCASPGAKIVIWFTTKKH